MGKLQRKIFYFFVTLLMIVQGISLWTIYLSSIDQADQQIESKVETASTVFDNQHQNRDYYLSAFAETTARDYGLKQVFNDDTRSLLTGLNNHRKRIGAHLAIAISNSQENRGVISGQLITQTSDADSKVTVGPQQGKQFPHQDTLTSKPFSGLYQIEQSFYQLSLAPLTSGNEIVGWIGFGYLYDNALIQDYAKLTGLNAVFVQQATDHTLSMIESSEAEDTGLKVKTLDAIVRGRTPDHLIAIVRHLGTLNDADLNIVLYGQRDSLLLSVTNRWIQLTGLVLITLIMSLAGAYFISAGITRPVTRLVQQAKHIARGNYDHTLPITENNELGQLASEFNQMQQAVLSREQQITYSLYHDSLTQLPNRNKLTQIIDDMLANKSPGFAVLMINIRGIANINDTLGYEVGNDVIMELANRLQAVKNKTILTHHGGDEFVMLVEDLTGDYLEKLLNQSIIQIEDVLKPGFFCKKMDLHLQVRIGVATYPEHGETSDMLLKKADTALRQAKANHAWWQQYDASQDFNSVERLQLIHDLRHAISDGQLVLFYQPKLTLETGKIEHLEALVRWMHPVHGMVPPDSFIHLAEQTGQINALTDWVIDEAARQHKAWLDTGLRQVIAINVSAENLKCSDFAQRVQTILNKHNVSVDGISLEITESAVVDDPESAIKILEQLKQHGFKLSIDDYGTGYSSLAQLKQLPVHELKIDKSFVLNLNQNDDDKIIVTSTIELAHNMGLSVVAEGVEDEESMNWLRQQGCELGQGFHISRPLPADKYIAWLEESRYFTRSVS